MNARGLGGELGGDFLLTKELTGFFNYSTEIITQTKDNPYTAEDEKGERVKSNPERKINVGLRLKPGNVFSANLLIHQVSKTEWLTGPEQSKEEVKPYTIVNTRIGYQFLDSQAEASLAVFNLFNRKHYEFPAGSDTAFSYGEEIGRMITFNLNYKF